MTVTADRTASSVATVPRRTARPVRTPRVLQMEAVECGAAALGIVLGHYGRHVPLEELRIKCGVSRDGSKASNVVKAAREYGLQTKGMQMDIGALGRGRPPAILFWDFNHFVVWEGFGRRFGRPVAYINDPGMGRRRISAEQFDGSFTGVVLTMAPGRRFRRGGRRPSTLRDLPHRLRGAGPALTIAVLSGLLAIVVSLGQPGFTRAFLDFVLTGVNRSMTTPLLVAMTTALVVAVCVSLLQQLALRRAHLSLATFASARFMRHLLRLPVQFFAQRNPADIAQRLDSHETLAGGLVGWSFTSVSSVVVLLTYAGVMWSYDRRLTVLGLATVAVNVLLVRFVMRARSDATAGLRVENARVAGVAYSGLHLIETMKATGGEEAFFRRWSGAYARLLNRQQEADRPAMLLTALTPAIAVAGSGLILMTGALSVVQGTLSIGVLVAFQTLARQLEQPVTALADLGPQLQNIDADVTRLRDVEDFAEDNLYVRPEPDRARRLCGDLIVRDVTFGYSRLAPPVLRDVEFSVRPGEQIALVGGSGSGKSTISRLLTGLYSAWSGEILFDGRPVATISRAVLASSVAFVDQDIHLFAGTVRENVTLWDPTIPDSAVVAALRDAQLYDVVASRTAGLDALVDQEGRNFSGGQRQRLEIARALVRDPAVLVLDEATSALDADTEHVIGMNLRRRGCTRVVIAHRLSTIRDSDQILVLEAGSVVERGTHDELISFGGRYAGLTAEI